MPAYRLDFLKRLQLPAVVITADTPAQAIRFAAQALMECTTLRGEEVASAVMSGVKIYDARDPQIEMNLSEPPVLSATTSSVTWSLPDGSSREMFLHKEGCLADPWTPISGKGCKCTKLDIPPETTHGE